MNLLRKVKYHHKLALFFRKLSLFLKDGYYTVDGKEIKKIESRSFSYFKTFRVNSNNNKLFNYDHGILFFTKYKSGFLTDDKAFYFINSKKRYYLYKSNFLLYKKKLLYPSLNLEFVDNMLLVFGPFVYGSFHNDSFYFDLFLNSLFQHALKSEYIFKTFNYDDYSLNLPWYVQHGDCKNTNIVWEKNEFTLIDLEAIDLYPPLYDVFYYLFITKKEDSVEILKSEIFQNSIKNFYKNSIGKFPENIVDISLACYANFTVSKLKKGMDLFETEFYLFWRKYDSFQNYPLTKKILDEYEKKIIEFRIK